MKTTVLLGGAQPVTSNTTSRNARAASRGFAFSGLSPLPQASEVSRGGGRFGSFSQRQGKGPFGFVALGIQIPSKKLGTGLFLKG